jgi:hypothetical protein
MRIPSFSKHVSSKYICNRQSRLVHCDEMTSKFRTKDKSASKSGVVLEQYQYQPLNEPNNIRLLELENGSGPTIACRLLHVNLNNLPKYDALSYTWGDNHLSNSILCEGRTLHVTKNLFQALSHLRKSAFRIWSRHFFWIDAICINQTNLPERNAQVRLMADIYCKASKVIVWLGEEHHSHRTALRAVDSLDNWIMQRLRRDGYGRETKENSGFYPSEMPSDFRKDFDLHLNAITTKDPENWGDRGLAWSAISNFLNNPWCTRTWVIQEVAFGSQVVMRMGDRKADMNAIYRVIYSLRGSSFLSRLNSNSAMNGIVSMGLYRDVMHGQGSRTMELIDLVVETYSSQASDPRDKLFALLNISPEKDVPSLRPDYTQDVATIYRRFATYELETKGSFDVLSLLSSPSPAVSKVPPETYLPSWVPDLSRSGDKSREGGSATLLGLNYSDLYSASKGTEFSVRFINEGNYLVSAGKILDSIIGSTDGDALHLRMYDESFPRDFISHLARVWRPWSEECDKLIYQTDDYPTGENIVDVHWRTMINDIQPGEPVRRVEETSKDYLRSSFHAWRDLYYLNDWDHDSNESIPNLDDIRMFFSHVRTQGWGCFRFFRTKKGYIGRADLQPQVGDLLCVLNGGNIPFLLRLDSERGGHQLLGEAYVHGIMDGEAMDMRDTSAQDIIIV